MEAVDDKLPVANGFEDDDSSVNQLPLKTSVNWKRTAKAFEAELIALRPLVVENRRLEQCVGGISVLGRALKDCKGEVRRLRGLLVDMDVSPDDTGGKHTASKDRPQVTPDNETVGDKDDDKGLEGNTEGGIEAEDVMTLPTDEDEGDGKDDAEEDTEEMELIVELSKLEGVCQNEYLTALENQSKLTPPLLVTFGEREVRNRESKLHQTGLNGDSSKTEFETNGGKIDTVNAEQDQETYCNMEALITPVTTSSKDLPHKEISTNVSSDATITNNDSSFSSTNLKHQEFSSIKFQVHELKKVNLEWKNHLKRKTSEFIAELLKKDQTIGRLQTQLDDAVKEGDIKATQYEQTLLTAKTRIEIIEDENRGLKKDVSKEKQRSEKSEMLNRSLSKQNQNMTNENMRLKQALEKKYHQHVHVDQSPCPETATTYTKQSRSTEPNDDAEEPYHNVDRDAQTHLSATCAPMPLKAPADAVNYDVQLTASQNVQDVSEKKKQLQENRSKVTDKSLSKQDMKEQVELLRQQNQMYESDFKKERADSQKARNELLTLRHQLHKQKKKTKGQIKDDIKTKAQGPPKFGAYSPPDQKLESESKPRRDHNKLKIKPIGRTDKDVKHGHDAICKVAGSQAIIIQTGPEGRGFQINLQAQSDTVRGRKGKPALHEPFICPRCQKLFTESDWESFEHHVTLCMR